MRCRGVRMQLSAYADGELAPRAARELEQHLASCEQCVAELARTRQIKRLTALVPTEELPAGLHSRLMTRLAYTSPTPTPVAASGMSPCDVWRALGLAGASVGLASLLLGQMSRGVAAPALPAPPLTNLVPASATATPGQPALPQPAPAVPVSPPVLSVQTDPTAGVAPAPPAAPAPGVEPAGLLPVPSERRVSGSVVRSRMGATPLAPGRPAGPGQPAEVTLEGEGATSLPANLSAEMMPSAAMPAMAMHPAPAGEGGQQPGGTSLGGEDPADAPAPNPNTGAEVEPEPGPIPAETLDAAPEPLEGEAPAVVPVVEAEQPEPAVVHPAPQGRRRAHRHTL